VGYVTSSDSQSPVLLFLHLPKTGGTTLNKLVYKSYQRPGLSAPEDPGPDVQPLFSYAHDGIYQLRGGFHQPIADDELPEMQHQFDNDPPRVILGHFVYGFHKALRDRPFQYLTMVREPVSRVISLYSHLQRFDDDARVDATRSTLRAFASHPRIRNDQARRLSGLEPERHPPSTVLREAKENLRRHFLLTGVTERFDEALVLLRRGLGWHSIHYRPKLVNRERTERADLPRDVLDAVKAANRIDLELYAYARDLFQERVDREASDFDGDLRAFRKENRQFIEEHMIDPVELDVTGHRRASI